MMKQKGGTNNYVELMSRAFEQQAERVNGDLVRSRRRVEVDGEDANSGELGSRFDHVHLGVAGSSAVWGSWSSEMGLTAKTNESRSRPR